MKIPYVTRVTGAALPRVLALAVERAVPRGLAHLARVGRVPGVAGLILIPVLGLPLHGLGQGVLGGVVIRTLNEFWTEDRRAHAAT